MLSSVSAAPRRNHLRHARHVGAQALRRERAQDARAAILSRGDERSHLPRVHAR